LRIAGTIREMSKRTYVTVGMVFTEDNIDGCKQAVEFASSLGVADIRVIPAAQYAKALTMLNDLSDELLAKHPILKYRIQNAAMGKPIRGLSPSNARHCRLALDKEGGVGVRVSTEKVTWNGFLSLRPCPKCSRNRPKNLLVQNGNRKGITQSNGTNTTMVAHPHLKDVE